MRDNNTHPVDNNTYSITDVLTVYFRHWKWFMLSISLCLLVGAIYIYKSDKKYKTSISILLNETKNTSAATTSALDLESFGIISTTNNIDNEITILSSPDLIKKAVEATNYQVSYFSTNTIGHTDIYDTTPLQVTYQPLNGSGFGGTINLELTKNDFTFALEGSYTSADKNGIFRKTFEKLPIKLSLPDELGILDLGYTHQKLNNGVYNIVIHDVASTVSDLSSQLSVSPASKGSSILEIGLTVGNKKKGANLLYALVNQYNTVNADIESQIVSNSSAFINERLQKITVELGNIENDVVDYRKGHNITDLDSETQLYFQQTGFTEQKKAEIETQLNVITLIENYTKDPANKNKMIPNLGFSDPTLTNVISEYNTKLIEYDRMMSGMSDENPTYKKMADDLTNTRSNILGVLKNVKQTFTISFQDVNRLSKAVASRVTNLPEQEKQLLEKKRQQQVKENLFLFLMQKREEMNIAMVSKAEKARIISSPQLNTPPISPEKKKILLIAITIGLIIPLVIIYMRNILNTKLTNTRELDRLARIDIIGSICKTKSSKRPLVFNGTRDTNSEQFRQLRNNITASFENKSHKIIMVTSTIDNEGKTFIATNLALSYALLKKKVLLIEGDLRSPKLNKYLHQNNEKGLTELISISTNNFADYISPSEIDPNLDILFAGRIPKNPNEFLLSSDIDNALNTIKQAYDVVILCTAPVAKVSDAYLMSRNIDMTLYVVCRDITPRKALSFINKQQKESKLTNIKLVCNKVLNTDIF